jgi:hypothetical protein
MLFPVLKMTCISAKGGGGDTGMVVGTARKGMTVIGIIIQVIPPGLRSYHLTGEIIIETIDGATVPGTRRIFIIAILTGTGATATDVMTVAGDLPIPGDVREVVRMVVMAGRMAGRMVVRAVVRGSRTFFLSHGILQGSSTDGLLTKYLFRLPESVLYQSKAHIRQ